MNPRLLFRLKVASPITIAGAVALAGMLTLGAFAAVGMVVPGPAGPRAPASAGALLIAGRSAHGLSPASAPPTATPPAAVPPASPAPVAPASSRAGHGAAAAAPAAPRAAIDPSVTAVMVRMADPGQFQDVNFGCASGDLVVAPGSQATLMCAVTSLNGFSGQIRTECDPYNSPYLTLPFGGLSANPGYVTCSGPTVTVPAGGGVTIPITVQVSAAVASGRWGAPVFLTLWDGASMLNADPYGFGLSAPAVPVDFSLACQEGKLATDPATVTPTTGGPPVEMSLGPELVGSCTLTAGDQANIVPTWVEVRGITGADATNASIWSPCLGSSESDVLGGAAAGCGTRQAVVTPAGGTGTVWFSLEVPPTAIGTGPTTITFEASHDQQSWPVSTTLTISF